MFPKKRRGVVGQVRKTETQGCLPFHCSRYSRGSLEWVVRQRTCGSFKLSTPVDPRLVQNLDPQRAKGKGKKVNLRRD